MAIESKAFIETQFPVSKLSKESYKERKANLGQTLTGLGKWWGRKPLVVVRAALLGLLLPASQDPHKDREVFLKLMTMDEEGLRRRRSKSLPLKELYSRLSDEERQHWFTRTSTPDKPKYKQGIKAKDKQALQLLVFQRLSYDEKLEYCQRPEHLVLTCISFRYNILYWARRNRPCPERLLSPNVQSMTERYWNSGRIAARRNRD